MEETQNENITTPEIWTAGEMLRNARTTGRRRREIQTIAKQLCIKEEFLQALEDGNYTVIPELVYILGFARNYAMELGLNPDEIVEKIKQEMGVRPDTVITPDAVRKPDAGGTGTNAMWRKIRAFCAVYWKWIIGVLLGVSLIICAIWAVAVSVTENESQPVEPTDTVVPTTVVSNPPAAVMVTVEQQYNVTVRERFGAENCDDSRVVLQAVRGEPWVQVKNASGAVEFGRALVPGDLYCVPPKGNFTATFGDAGAIDVWVDGKLAPKQGADNVRKNNISLSPDKLMSVEKETTTKQKSTKPAKETAPKPTKQSEYGTYVEE